jgi:hypothetical protein
MRTADNHLRDDAQSHARSVLLTAAPVRLVRYAVSERRRSVENDMTARRDVPTVPAVLVHFWRIEDNRFTRWEADRGHRRIVPGTPWKDGGARLPHDLAGMVIEVELGLAGGFWSCVAAGATFKSLGRKVTKPGRQVIREHRAQLDEAEHAVHAVIGAWQSGVPTPVTDALERVASTWATVDAHSRLTISWPDLHTSIDELPDGGKGRR